MKQRQAYIFYKVYWEGEISRKDLTDRFKITPIQASKNFAEFKKDYPGAIIYDASIRRYVPDCAIERNLPSKDFQDYLHLVRPDGNSAINILPDKPFIPVSLYRVLNRAIKNNLALQFVYHSLNTPNSKKVRTVYPHILVNSGYRWHLRGWEEQSGLFKDFNLSRIVLDSFELVSQKKPKAESKHDKAWNNKVSVCLIPNPSLSESERDIISLDFNMQDSILDIHCRQALLLYTLNSYLVTDFSKNPPKTQLLSIGNLNTVKSYLPGSK